MKVETKWERLRMWGVMQKVTLMRGYGWLQVPMIGFIAASQFKLMFPAIFDGIWSLVILTILSTLVLWSVGYLDRKFKILHAENTYATATNPLLMRVVNNIQEEK